MTFLNFFFFFHFFPGKRTCHFFQIVSIGDNLHEMSNPVFWDKKNINLSSAELAKRVVKVKILIRALDKKGIRINIFSYFSVKTYIR